MVLLRALPFRSLEKAIAASLKISLLPKVFVRNVAMKDPSMCIFTCDVQINLFPKYKILENKLPVNYQSGEVYRMLKGGKFTF